MPVLRGDEGMQIGRGKWRCHYPLGHLSVTDNRDSPLTARDRSAKVLSCRRGPMSPGSPRCRPAVRGDTSPARRLANRATLRAEAGPATTAVGWRYGGDMSASVPMVRLVNFKNCLLNT